MTKAEAVIAALKPKRIVQMPVWKCDSCGCLWRDNLDWTVSLLDANQTTCQGCEAPASTVRWPPTACSIHWLTAIIHD